MDEQKRLASLGCKQDFDKKFILVLATIIKTK